MNVIALLDPINAMLVGASAVKAGSSSWLLLAPISADRASYSPLIVLVVIVAVVLLTVQVVHRYYHGRVRRAPALGLRLPRADAAHAGHGRRLRQPIRTVFEPFFRMKRHLPSPFDAAPRYEVTVEDHFWYWLYLPIARGAEVLARLVGMIQQGRISVYLTYSFFTLLALLFFVR